MLFYLFSKNPSTTQTAQDNQTYLKQKVKKKIFDSEIISNVNSLRFLLNQTADGSTTGCSHRCLPTFWLNLKVNYRHSINLYTWIDWKGFLGRGCVNGLRYLNSSSWN